MRKMHVSTKARSGGKKALAAALALTMAVPSALSMMGAVTPDLEAQAADDDALAEHLVMTVDMTGGFQQESKSIEEGGSGMAVITGPSEYDRDDPFGKTKQENVLQFTTDRANNKLYTIEVTNAHGEKETQYVPFMQSDDYKKGVMGNQPTSAYDSEMGNVLMLDTYLDIPKYVKNHKAVDDESYLVAEGVPAKMMETVDEKYPVYTEGYKYEIDRRGVRKEVANNPEAEEKATLQDAVTIESAVRITNPFAGRDDLVEDTSELETYTSPSTGAVQYKWQKGVTISYWVKMPEDTRSEEEKKAVPYDTNLIVFQNLEKDDVYQADDWNIHEAIMGYYATHDADGKPNGETYVTADGYGKYTAADYDFSDPVNIEDEDGNTWKVVEEHGKLMCYNPKAADLVADGDVYIYSNGDTVDYSGYTLDGEPLSLQAVKGYRGTGYDKLPSEDANSIMRYGKISGSMQIQASGAFHFVEDDYGAKSMTLYNQDGTPQTNESGGEVQAGVAVKGAKQLNPKGPNYYDETNPDPNNEFFQFRQNILYFEQNQETFPSPVTADEVKDADGNVLVEKGQGKWHYMTVVIMNDAVEIYEDGKKVPMKDRLAGGQAIKPDQIAKKHFNYGTGYRGYGDMDYSFNNNKEWNADGQNSTAGGPCNSYGRSIMQWLTDEDTYLQLGGQGSGALAVGQDKVHSVEGTLMDDIKFYDIPMTEEQAIADYEQAKASKAHQAVQELKSYSFDEDANEAQPAGMELASTNDSSSADQPNVVNDGTRGHVLRLPASPDNGTSAVKLTENPFSKQAISQASMSYWVKALPGGVRKTIMDGFLTSFVDEEKVLVHDKIQTAFKDTKSRTQLYMTMAADAYFLAGCNTGVYDSLDNKYEFSIKREWGSTYKPVEGDPDYDQATKESYDKWNELLASFDQWHHVIVNINDSGLEFYVDGEPLTNNLTDKRTGKFGGFGGRFFDGYYNKMYDAMASEKLGSNNQGATSLMSFLTQEDTSAYLGYALQTGVNNPEINNCEMYVDDLTYYSGNVTAEEAKALYQEAAAKEVGPVAGEPIYAPSSPSGSDKPDDSDNPSEDETQKQEATTNADGSLTATANGVTVNVPAGGLPAGTKVALVVTVLGTQSSASTYAEADSVLNTISGLSIGKRVLYDIHFEDEGGQTITPSKEVSVSIVPISGYTASNCSVVSIGEKKLLQVTVSGSSLNFSSQAMGLFAVVEAKAGETPAGSTAGGTVTSAPKSSDSGSSKAGQTGDMADVVMPILLLGAAVAAVVYIRRKQLINQ